MDEEVITNEDKSLKIYEELISNNLSSDRVELKLVPVISFGKYDDVIFKIKIGINKLYLMSNKCWNFNRAFDNKNGIVNFGNNFSFDGAKHYFNKEDEAIYKVYRDLISTGNYYDEKYALLDDIKLHNLLGYLKDKTFEVEGYGLSYGVKEENPVGVNILKEGNNYKIDFNLNDIPFLGEDFRYYFDKGLCVLPEKISEVLRVMDYNNVNSLVLDEEKAINFNKKIFKNVSESVVVDEEIKDKFKLINPVVKLYFDYKDDVLCDVCFKYGDTEVNYYDEAKSFRNEEFEDDVIRDLRDFCFEQHEKKLVITKLGDMVYFFEEGINKLDDSYEIFTTNKFKKGGMLKNNSISSQFSIGTDNIMTYNFELGAIDDKELSKLFDSMTKKEKYYKLKNGKIIDTDNKALNELKEVMESLDVYDIAGVIPKYRALYLDSVKDYDIVKTDNMFDNFINNFNKYKDCDVSIEEKDFNILRDYQKTGVKWLYNIYKSEFGGILADEMGLGKTIQTIMFIKNVIKEKKDAKILIVAPTALIYNWKKEFDMFGPELSYLVVAGGKQDRISKLESSANIMITTYGMLRQDADIYDKKDFELIIIDEAQNIKNPKAGISLALKTLNSKVKIALTGTPVENSVLEIWSIFDFIMPGFLNNLSKFSSKFNFKDIDEDAHDKLALLQKIINPFILRRRKRDVLNDLPEKFENVIYLDLPEKQKKVYAMQVKKSREEFEELIEKEGFLKARFKILQLLTRLRQICVEPTLVFDSYDGESIKMEEIVNMVKNYIDNNHKILIFTSFKSALEILKSKLDNDGVSNYVIDGSVNSKERTERVDAFNKDNTNVFLITLKAGGTGLNLTSADVVIHLDLWWNPQAENQATDRAHRIGQKNKVEVVKLVCKGTIEEKIIELQNKKKVLNDTLIDSENIDEAAFSKLNENDIIDLLSITEE